MANNIKSLDKIQKEIQTGSVKNSAISIPLELVDKLKSFSPDSLRANTITIIERYFEIIKKGRREVRKTFSDNELALIADICNGTSFEPFRTVLEYNVILIQYEDAAEIYGKHYNKKWQKKWQVDDLTDKLSSLSKLGQIGLIDVIDSFWNGEYLSVADVFKN